MITGISHIAFAVSDMQRSVDFYCRLLGLTEAFDIMDDKGQPSVKYIKICKGQFLELLYHEQPKGMNIGGYSHLCLSVDDAERTAELLVSRGICLQKPVIHSPQTGNSIFWVADPDGNRIEFMQVHPDSPQSKA